MAKKESRKFPLIIKKHIAILMLFFVTYSAAEAEKSQDALSKCPLPDYSKNTDKERISGWNNCIGEYKFEFSENGLVIHAEFFDGKPNGKGIAKYQNGAEFIGEFKNGKYHGYGIYSSISGEKYAGEYKNGEMHGRGTRIYRNGDSYVGEINNGNNHGRGLYYLKKEDKTLEGIFENNKFIREEKINFTNNNEKKNQKQLNINISATQPSLSGEFVIGIQTNSDTASLLINGEEQGGRADGKYSINKVARAGQETVFTIVATGVNGNTDTKTITVNRPVIESQAKFTPLNPTQVKRQPERDAVAIIIGIADYKNLPRADFANDDASVFYDYAIRALGIKPENIKLLVDANADDVAIYQAFKTWLPSRTGSTTDVYVYYSGHGLPAVDGQGLYLLPQRAHRDLIEKTAISQQEINGFIQAARPRSTTIFLDSCYSGLTRSGETLLASARPVVIKSDKKLFPENFTVLTASQADQISSSSPDLKHGIFSYYLMRGMEGEADADKDGRITAGEMHRYLSQQVARQAGMMNRRQEPQLVGDANRVLVGK